MSTSTLEPLARKLAIHTDISREERDALLSIRFDRRPVRSHEQLFRGAGPASHCYVLLDGYAARYKLLRNGSRQILNVLMRGDMVGTQRCLFRRADHDVEMLTQGTVATIAAAEMHEILSAYPNLAHAIWSETLFDAGIQSEWIVNLGRRDAAARLAHLFCELGVRHEQQGLGRRTDFALPLTQSHIADCAGLTAVHVNRVLRLLSEAGLIERHRGQIGIQDWAALTKMAGFDEQYLQPAETEAPALPQRVAMGF
ncbi:Crp/Fnr family transcriptional regulator [Sphingomonas sp.]|uniref:Crp/Fnr family transcriptional regulator n=1 Tax=Sphingomonas sp. TaxID=28214 RepID=UPI002D7FF724|nr:Crp/Fnr family transcriptional regulator [Sphingomonas sp.]HEU0044958.1 Crp/Fnr family transcriptional regulator [Sphingomonas sp.]